MSVARIADSTTINRRWDASHAASRAQDSEIAESTPRETGGPAALRHDLRASLLDVGTYSVMVGAGETYMAAFALALGMGAVASGLVATIPMLVGAVLQLVSPRGVYAVGSYRTWVVACACFQAASLLLLPMATLVDLAVAGPLVFLAASLYWASGLAGGPGWNTWIENVVPRTIRSRFFALRVRVGQACILLGLVTAGLVLQLGASYERTLLAFSLLFAVSAASRFISARALAAQREPAASRNDARTIRPAHWARSFQTAAGGRLLVYLFAVQVAVQISGPYFTSYMLKELGLSYVGFVSLIGLAFLGKILALPLFGRIAHRYGARRLLWIGGIGIVPMSGFWIFSDSFYYLMIVQLLSGVVWSCYELAMLLMFFEAIPKQERTSVLTIYNLGNSAAMAAGALLGGSILAWMGPGAGGFYVLFGVSVLARAATTGLLARVPSTTRSSVVLATRTIAVQPDAGSIDRPILIDENAAVGTDSVSDVAAMMALPAEVDNPADPLSTTLPLGAWSSDSPRVAPQTYSAAP